MRLSSEYAGQIMFDEASPTLDSDELVTRHTAWQSGETVLSGMVAVGSIALDDDAALLLAGRRILTAQYARLEHSPLLRQCHALTTALSAVVRYDMARCGLEGRLETVVHGGNYDAQIHREPWHSDNFHQPSVRWTVAFGVGPTLGASGPVSRADTDPAGDLLPHISVTADGQLRPVAFPEGAVTRFQNSGDIHAGPAGRGPRLMARSTLTIGNTTST